MKFKYLHYKTLCLFITFAIVFNSCQKDLVEPNPDFTISKSSAKVNEEITISMTGGADAYCIWTGDPSHERDKNTGTSVTNNKIVVKYTIPGTYTITVMATNYTEFGKELKRAEKTATIVVADSEDLLHKSFSKFSLRNFGIDGYSDLTADTEIDERTISVQVPFQTNLTQLIATFEVKKYDAAVLNTLTKVFINGTLQQNDTTPNDFSQPVTYTLQAIDGSTATYTVNVTKAAANTEKTIVSFKMKDTQNLVEGVTETNGNNITVVFPVGTDVSQAVVNYQSSAFSRLKIGPTVLPLKVFSWFFSYPVTITVVAEDGSTATYVVTVKFNPEIRSFTFKNLNPEVHGVITDNTISMTVLSGTPIDSIAPYFVVVPVNSTITVNDVPQISGTTANDFRNPVVYKITSQGIVRQFTVNVNVVK